MKQSTSINLLVCALRQYNERKKEKEEEKGSSYKSGKRKES